MTQIVAAITLLFVTCSASKLFCRRNSCYRLELAMLSFDDAEKACRLKDGHLAYVPDRETNDFLVNAFGSEIGGRVWIGLKFNANYEKWQWTNGKPAGYHHADNIPFHSYQVAITIVNSGQWVEESLGNSHARICEFPHARDEIFERIHTELYANVTNELVSRMNKSETEKRFILQVANDTMHSLMFISDILNTMESNLTDAREDIDLLLDQLLEANTVLAGNHRELIQADNFTKQTFRDSLQQFVIEFQREESSTRTQFLFTSFLILTSLTGFLAFVAYRKNWIQMGKVSSIFKLPKFRSNSNNDNNPIVNQSYVENV
ncbi:unnamed protein product, partial [Mesorhabditis belari]|uniref:C-type lectin domain-containing protein n=1 Tax=Mesorhabditis belari TaxID=2138241 RepID=A0AAF3FFL6_9BILA